MGNLGLMGFHLMAKNRGETFRNVHLGYAWQITFADAQYLKFLFQMYCYLNIFLTLISQ